MKKYILFLLVTFTGFSQQKIVDSLLQAGDVFYKAKNYKAAAPIWEKAAEFSDFSISKRDYYYYSASAFAEAKDSTNSFRCLEIGIKKHSFNDISTLKNDNSFDYMRNSKKWIELIKSIKIPYSTNEKKIVIVNSDVENFWKAYDLILKNPSKEIEIYKNNYFNIGTLGLQFYYLNKINSVENFVKVHNSKPKFYKSIRKNSLKTNTIKKSCLKSFKNLKKVYSKAIFPPIYFVVGKLNSGGTSSSDGLILSIDQACVSKEVDISELDTWERNNCKPFNKLQYTIAHELIHFQQNEMAVSNTLLKGAILEGMADFIGELISGETSNERLKVYATGKEKEILTLFKKEMLLDNWSNWIANSDQETEEKPADLGYWVGYQICKSYYENSKNKSNAVNEMLSIKDYEKFWNDSKIELKIW